MSDRSLAKALAAEALKAASITVPPVDLDDLAGSRGLRVERNVELGAGTRAAYRPEDGLVQVIALPPRVERFPVAHEIGHSILGDAGQACTEQMIMAQSEAVSLEEATRSFNPEVMASLVASQLLIPTPWLRRAVATRTFDELQELFDVTRPVLMIAIMRDGLLTRVRTG